MTQETIEGNKLIDIFKRGSEVLPDGKQIGMKRGSSPKYYNYYDIYLIKELKYRTSFDWLMPVWKKIIDLKLIETEDLCIREPWQYMNPIRNAISDCDINEAWKCIVNLLTWYNLTQKH